MRDVSAVTIAISLTESRIAASYLVSNLLDPELSDATLQDHSNRCIIAVSIYLASHLKGLPRTSSELSAVVTNADPHHIRANYDLVILRRIIDDRLLYDLAEDSYVWRPTWPHQGNESLASENTLREVTDLCAD